MKRLILSTSLLCASLSAFAGTADIPHWQVGNAGQTCIYISNTSGVPANVTVNLYKRDGSEYLGALISRAYLSSLGEKYTLPAMATSTVCVKKTGSTKAYAGCGTIEATTADGYQGEIRMLAHAHFANSDLGFSIPINGGMPF